MRECTWILTANLWDMQCCSGEKLLMPLVSSTIHWTDNRRHMKKCIQPEQAEKNSYKLRKKHHVHMANLKNLRVKHKPSQQPHPPHFFNGPSLSHCINYPTNGLNQTDKASPFPTPETVRGMGTSFRWNGLWDRLGGQGLVTIGHGSQGNH